MKRNYKKIFRNLIIFLVAVIIIGIILFFYLRKGYWDNYSSEGNEIYGENSFLTGQRIKGKPELKYIFNINRNSGEITVRFYKIPEDDPVAKLINTTDIEEVGKLYQQGANIEKRNNQELVYEQTYSQSGEYVIESNELSTGTYIMELYFSQDADIKYTLDIMYKKYNWMKWEKKIKSFFGDYDEEKYEP